MGFKRLGERGRIALRMRCSTSELGWLAFLFQWLVSFLDFLNLANCDYIMNDRKFQEVFKAAMAGGNKSSLMVFL